MQVGDDGSVLPATEYEVFQSLVSGSGNGLSSFDPDGSDAGEEDEDEEEEEDDEGNEFDTDEDEQDERGHNSKSLRPKVYRSCNPQLTRFIYCIHNERCFINS